MLQPQYSYQAVVTNVVDGDTIDALVDLGFYVQVNVRFRLFGINTQETNDQDPAKRDLAIKAKQYVIDNLLNKKVSIRSHKTDKYGRWLGEIFIDNALSSFNYQMINQGLAVAYNGGARG
jgi:micrococcal nuclease